MRWVLQTFDTDAEYVNVSGDTMTGTLGGVNATESNHFMPCVQDSVRAEKADHLGHSTV